MADQKISELNSITGANVDDANDELAIVDANASETKRITRAELFKGIDGDVGIGTSSPSEILHVQADDPNIWIDSTSIGETSFNGGRSANGGLLLTASDMNTSSKYTPAIMFGSTDANFTTNSPRIGAAIVAEAEETFASNDDGAMALTFWTRDSTATTNQNAVERMRIDENGNVGIGTSSPGSKLSVVGLPTSSAGLSAGDIWNDGGTLKIV